MTSQEKPGTTTTTSMDAGDSDNPKVKVICLGDSAVGKSKLVERFLMDDYRPQQLSTFALTLFKYSTKVADRYVSFHNPIPFGAY